MNSVVEAAFSSWTFRFWPFLAVAFSAVLYLRGWWRLRALRPERFTVLRAMSFLLGLALLYCAVASPLDAFANLLLQAHMIQHLLLMMVVPPLIWMGNPSLPLLSGLPRVFVREIAGPLLTWHPVRALGSFFTWPPVCWLLFVGMNITWHVPPLYELALRSPSWHEFEHFCFLSSALLFWWPVILPWPGRSRWPRWALIPYLLLADIQNTALAGFLYFYEGVLYPTYQAAPRLWCISPLQDQTAAGAIMWVPGSIVFLIPTAIITLQLFAGRRGVRPSEYLKPSPVTRHATAPVRPSRRRNWRDLLEIPLLGPAIRSPFFRRAVQFLLLVLAVCIVLDGLLGPEISPLNLAGVLPWTHWRGLSVIALLAIGNLFCMACPFTFARDMARKILPARRAWPAALRSKWIAVALLVLYLWAYEAFSLWNSPWLTAWIILGYFSAAIVIDGFFKGASFCKYVCPIGQFNFVQSLISPFEIKVRSHDVCASCKTHDCIRGNTEQRGCELRLFQPHKQGNMDCTFCLDCIKACPHDNVGILATPPASDLFHESRRSSVGPYSRRPDIACMAAVLVFGAFVNAAGMVAPVVEWQQRLQNAAGWNPLLVSTLFFIVILFLLPALLLGICSRASLRFALPGTKLKSLLCDFVMALVPLGASLWAAHFVFHLVTAFETPVPVFHRLLAKFNGATSPAVSPASMAFPNLPALEILLLDFGLLLTLYAMWRIAPRYAAPQRHLAVLAPWALLALFLFMAGIWIVFQPMEMRGTLLP